MNIKDRRKKFRWFLENLVVGAKIKIGKQYAENFNFQNGEIITLVEGTFHTDTGFDTVTSHSPSIWNKEENDFDSIFHLFGNNFEDFLDCEIIK